MVRGDWPELEYLVIGTGVKVLHANEAVASVSAVVQALNEANSALPDTANGGGRIDVCGAIRSAGGASRGSGYHPRDRDGRIAPGQSRIFDIIDDDHEAAGVAEEYLGGAVSLGAAAAIRDRGTRHVPRSLEQLGRTLPPVDDATAGLASATRRVLVALEPASGWGDRSPRSCLIGLEVSRAHNSPSGLCSFARTKHIRSRADETDAAPDGPSEASTSPVPSTG